MRYYDVKVGQHLKIGDAIIKVEKKSGQQVRLAVDKPESLRVEVGTVGVAPPASKGLTGFSKA